MCALRFIPREERFYEYFASQSAILKEIAERIATGINGGAAVMTREAEAIALLEQRADDINQEVFEKLRKTFITPLDPEDIHTLTSKLEDAIDSAYVLARRISVYRPATVSQGLRHLSDNFVAISKELDAAVSALRNGAELRAHCIRIREIEEDSDRCAQDGLLELFSNQKDPIEVIKGKDLLEMLEQTIDICDDVADVLANVVVKNS